MTEPRVVIIIVNWNGFNDTIACIHSLTQLSYSHYQMLIVDNASTDDSVERIKDAFPDIEMMQTEANLGYAGGNNVGIRYALEQGADYVLLLNNDTYVQPDFLTHLVETAEQDPLIGGVCPKIYLPDSSRIWFIDGPINWWRGSADHPHYGEVDHGQFDAMHETDRVVGTALLIRRNILEQVGLLNESYFLYWEEAEWSMRTRRAGFCLLVDPRAVIWHNETSASGGALSPTFLYYHMRNGLRFIREYGSLGNFFAAFCYSVFNRLRLILYMLHQHTLSWRKIRAILLGYRDFFLGKSGQFTGKL